MNREVLAEAFDADDPHLAPEEKETTIRFCRDEAVAHFYTEEAGLGRRLIAHPESVVEEVIVAEGATGRPARGPGEVTASDHIVGVRGTLPIGALLRETPTNTPR